MCNASDSSRRHLELVGSDHKVLSPELAFGLSLEGMKFRVP